MTNVMTTATVVTHTYSKDGNKLTSKVKSLLDIPSSKYFEILKKSELPIAILPNGLEKKESWSYNINTGVFHIRQHSEIYINDKHIPEDGKMHFIEKGKYAKIENGEIAFYKKKQ